MFRRIVAGKLGPKILKIENYTGDWKEGEKVTGIISRASGVIDNLSNARGVLNIDSITTTPGKFIDDIGKPSEIVQNSRFVLLSELLVYH